MLEHDVNLTAEVLGHFIKEKRQRTNKNNQQRKRRRNRMDMSLLTDITTEEVEKLP